MKSFFPEHMRRNQEVRAVHRCAADFPGGGHLGFTCSRSRSVRTLVEGRGHRPLGDEPYVPRDLEADLSAAGLVPAGLWRLPVSLKSSRRGASCLTRLGHRRIVWPHEIPG